MLAGDGADQSVDPQYLADALPALQMPYYFSTEISAPSR